MIAAIFTVAVKLMMYFFLSPVEHSQEHNSGKEIGINIYRCSNQQNVSERKKNIEPFITQIIHTKQYILDIQTEQILTYIVDEKFLTLILQIPNISLSRQKFCFMLIMVHYLVHRVSVLDCVPLTLIYNRNYFCHKIHKYNNT
jgi:hypothetical protein